MSTSNHLFRLPLLTVVVLTFTACDAEQSSQGAMRSSAPLEVAVATVAAERVPLFTDLPGRTSAYRVAEVRPQVGGILVARLFEEGGTVEAGQPLYQIDPATYEAALQSAQADLSMAKADLGSIKAKEERYAQLVKLKAISRQDYDDAVASYDQAKASILVAEAAVKTARINLEYTKVYAPIGGRIGKSSVTEGALVTANQTDALATITQLDPIYVDLSQSSSELMQLRDAVSAGRVQPGQADQAKVTLLLDGSSGTYAQPGQLKFSDVTVDETTGSVQVRAVFPNPDKRLLPGLFVRARVEQGVRENAMLVPQQAVVRNPDGSAAVWVVGADDKAEQRPIETEQVVGDSWLVDSGLEPGDRVVVEGLQKLTPGAEVVVASDPGTQPAVAQSR